MHPNNPTSKQDFIDAGFNVIDGNDENPLLTFLQTHYPQVIQDGEVKLNELKIAIGLPIDEKVNGYGLNFIGRNVAKAKYTQETQKVVKINHEQSKNFDTTGNLILRGDNLDSLKILKNYFGGKIKMIYIDPPYNTDSDNFVYPDKFDQEEAKVLGLANLSDDDMERLEFSFGNKKSHNGWLAFMYPRLWLARELLSKDGVIFISIDDNEQANLKLLCDEVFGEANTEIAVWHKVADDSGRLKVTHRLRREHEYIIVCYKNKSSVFFKKYQSDRIYKSIYNNPDNDPRGAYKQGIISATEEKSKQTGKNFYTVTTPNGNTYSRQWRFPKEEFDRLNADNRIYFGKKGDSVPSLKVFINEKKDSTPTTLFTDLGTAKSAGLEVTALLDEKAFSYPKPLSLVNRMIEISTNSDSIILDFFAGSGTTGHAVMQLNVEDGGNRRFILCQIDEPIEKKHAAYKFCTKNKLPPVISSITVERLNRAGEKIKESKGLYTGMVDIGYKVLELVDAPRLDEDDDLLVTCTDNEDLTAQDRLTSLVFKVGVDDPALTPKEMVKDCLYRFGTRYYIVHSMKLDGEENRMKLKEALTKGEHIYVDGWTATLNTTLQDMRGKGKDKGKMQIVY